MRLGLISDVHGNLHALDAALAFLAGRDVDAYLCAGDLVGYGPLPNACVERLRELPGRCVAGNHDLIALGRLSDDRCAAIARDSLRWTRGALDDRSRAYLAELPLTASLAGVRVAHGSLTDPQEYVQTEDQALACLRELAAEDPEAAVLVVGHTHRAVAIGERRGTLLGDHAGEVRLVAGERMLVNPGAVGQSRSRDVRARVAVLDIDAGVATFHQLPYDVAGCRRALRAQGLPAHSHHLPRSRWRSVARRSWAAMVPARPRRSRSPRGLPSASHRKRAYRPSPPAGSRSSARVCSTSPPVWRAASPRSGWPSSPPTC
jgi:predicted phosphodiesterase